MNYGKAEYPSAVIAGSKISPGATIGAISLLDQARDTLRQANAVASRIMELSDRLCGARATEDRADCQTLPDGAFDRFRAEMRDTRQAMIFADDALTRIEQELIG